MPQHDLIVIGASAGGLEPLTSIVSRLPRRLPATLLVVMHTGAESNGVLPEILSRVSELPATFARTGDRLVHGRVYVAPPDRHLLVTAGGLRVAHGPRENGFRPAIDPLFRTAAREFGTRVVGIVLSGALSDGTFGLSVIKHRGGVAIVQDPQEALVSSMPLKAMNAVDVDQVLPAARIADAIEALAGSVASKQGKRTMSTDKTLEPQLPSEQTAVSEVQDIFGAPSALTCPDCGGALWEVKDGRLVRYQCHVSHQYGADSLELEQRSAVDSALWSAVRVLEEHADLKLRMARRAAGGGLAAVSAGFAEGAHEAREQAQRIRAVLFESDQRGGTREPAASTATADSDVPASQPHARSTKRRQESVRRSARKPRGRSSR